MTLRLGSFFNDVRGAVLTGLSVATSTAVAATDSILVALGKLQAQHTSEVATRAAQDTALTNDYIARIATETTNRTTAVSAEATSRTNADALLAPKASPAFSGTMTAASGTTFKLGPTGWLEAIIGGTETAVSGGLLSLSPTGTAGIVTGLRSSDTPNTGGMSFALGAFAINNNATQVQTDYCAYFECRRSAGAGTTQGVEIGTVNFGNVHDPHPYYVGDPGSTLPLWISGGRTDVGTNNNLSCAMGVIWNGASFSKGIVFGANSVAGSANVGAVAVAMPAGYSFTWYTPEGNATTQKPSAYIRSDISATTGFTLPPSIIFNQTGLDIFTADSNSAISCKSGLTTIFSTLHLDGGAVEVGSPSVAGSPYMDFHSSGGSARDYDARIIASGGSTTVDGQGTLTAHCTALAASGSIIAGFNVAAGPSNALLVTLPDSSGYGATVSTNAAGDVLLGTLKSGGAGTVRANDLVLASTDNVATAWTQVTGTIGAATGTPVGTAWIRYKRIGKTFYFNLDINITNNNGATGFITIAMPFAAVNAGYAMCCGREVGATGYMMQGIINPNATNMAILRYDNTYPLLGNTGNIAMSGVYETV